MIEILISKCAEHDRPSATVSIRVSLPSPGTRETQSPPLIAHGLGQGPLLPDNDALPYCVDRRLIDVESGVGVSFAQGTSIHGCGDVTPIDNSNGAHYRQALQTGTARGGSAPKLWFNFHAAHYPDPGHRPSVADQTRRHANFCVLNRRFALSVTPLIWLVLIGRGRGVALVHRGNTHKRSFMACY